MSSGSGIKNGTAIRDDPTPTDPATTRDCIRDRALSPVRVIAAISCTECLEQHVQAEYGRPTPDRERRLRDHRWRPRRHGDARPAGRPSSGCREGGGRHSGRVSQGRTPLAVMISHEEAERWRKIEDSLAALHALRRLSRSPRRSLGARRPRVTEAARSLAIIRKLTSEPRAILSPLRTIGVSEPGPRLRRWCRRWPKAGCERSWREATWPSPSFRHPNTTASALWLDRSAGSGAPGLTWPQRPSSKSSTLSVPIAEPPAKSKPRSDPHRLSLEIHLAIPRKEGG